MAKSYETVFGKKKDVSSFFAVVTCGSSPFSFFVACENGRRDGHSDDVEPFSSGAVSFASLELQFQWPRIV